MIASPTVTGLLSTQSVFPRASLFAVSQAWWKDKTCVLSASSKSSATANPFVQYPPRPPEAFTIHVPPPLFRRYRR